MRDPHIETLKYRLVVAEGVTFDHPPPIERSTEAFDVRLDDGELTFTMKAHHATEESARRQTDPYARAWEVIAGLNGRHSEISFRFLRCVIVDRSPPEDGKTIHELSGRFEIGVTMSASLSVTKRNYPDPPDQFTTDPLVESLWYRYERYLTGNEPLPSMGYFILTSIEGSTGAKSGRRPLASKQYGISATVLNTLARITSEHGDAQTARKGGNSKPLTSGEHKWVEAALKAIIRRVGEYAADPVQNRTEITMGDLPNVT